MSTQDFLEDQNGSEMDIDEGNTFFLDLNYPPPNDNMGMESIFTSYCPLESHAEYQRDHTQATNNGDEGDDDVVILSSPRSFLEARKNSRRNAEVIIVNDDDIEVQEHLESAQQDKIDTNLKLCLELFKSEAWPADSVQIPTETPSPEAPTFTCPICMDQLTEETSTKCGHIFCRECLEAAMSVKRRCPTCRSKLRKKDNIRIYLPGKK